MMRAQRPCRVVSAGSIAKDILEDISQSLEDIDRIPKLIGFLANVDPGARLYAEWTGKTCIKK